MNSLVNATAAVTVVAAAAAGSYISTGFVLSPPFLWLASNVITICLLSPFCRRNTTADDDTSSSTNDVLSAVDDLYPSRDYDEFATVVLSGGEAEAPVSSKPKRQAREAKAARRTDRVRVPKKPAGEAAAATTRNAAVESESGLWFDAGDKKRGDETPRTIGAAGEARPEDTDADDDVSLDTLWQSMVQRRAVRPVPVRKSETWGNEELPRLQRAAETAAKRQMMRKSVSSAAPPPQPEAARPSAVRQLGWRTRDVLVRAQDDLLRRAESLIRRHHEQLRLQRKESEQRQAMEKQHRRSPALIRV